MNVYVALYVGFGALVVGSLVVLVIAAAVVSTLYEDVDDPRRDGPGWVNLARFCALFIIIGICGLAITALWQFFAWLVELTA